MTGARTAHDYGVLSGDPLVVEHDVVAGLAADRGRFAESDLGLGIVGASYFQPECKVKGHSIPQTPPSDELDLMCA
jgi:hypothetical protein